MFPVGKKITLNSNVGFISCSLPAFLLKRLPHNAACFLRKFTVWHNRLSGTIIIKTPRDIGLTLSLMFPARTTFNWQFPRAYLPFVTFHRTFEQTIVI